MFRVGIQTVNGLIVMHILTENVKLSDKLSNLIDECFLFLCRKPTNVLLCVITKINFNISGEVMAEIVGEFWYFTALTDEFELHQLLKHAQR